MAGDQHVTGREQRAWRRGEPAPLPAMGERILRALVDHRFGSLTVSELADAAEVSRSTSRTWLHNLHELGLARPVHRLGLWTPTGEGELRIHPQR